MVAAAIAELRRGDVEDAFAGAFGNLMHEAEQVLRRIAEAHAAPDAALEHGGRTAHVERDHALIGIPDIDHASQLLVGRGQHIGGQQVVPMLLQRVKRFGNLLVGRQLLQQRLRGGFVDDAGRDELLRLRHFDVAQHEVEAAFFAGGEGHLHLMRRHRLPAGRDGVAHLAGENCLRVFKAVVQPKERLHVGVEAVHGGVHGVERIVIAALAVFGLVVDDAAFHLNLAGGEVALEVRHVVLRVPEAELDKRRQDNILGRVGIIAQRHLMHLGVHAHRHKRELAGGQTVLLTGDDGVAHAVAAGIAVQLSFDGLPAGIPDRVAVLDVEVAAAVVHGHVVVAVAGDAAQSGIAVEAIAAGGIADDAEELFAAEVVNPRVGRPRRVDDVLAGFVVKVTVFHAPNPPEQRT